MGRGFDPRLPLQESALERCGEEEILDLCSGETGPVLWMARELVAA